MREITGAYGVDFGDRCMKHNGTTYQSSTTNNIIQMHREYDQVISTADSHHSDPEAWKDRELYRRLAGL